MLEITISKLCILQSGFTDTTINNDTDEDTDKDTDKDTDSDSCDEGTLQEYHDLKVNDNRGV